MSPDLNDALSHIKENDDWAYDLIKFQLEQLQKDKAELRERNIQIANWCNEQTGEIRRLTKAFNQVGDSNE